VNAADTKATAKHIMLHGPDRVVINAEGDAYGPRQAQQEHGIRPTIIFIRYDGWSLGAPAQFEQVAFQMWADSWVAFIRRPDEEPMPISSYRSR
jgi:hypothetical protein